MSAPTTSFVRAPRPSDECDVVWCQTDALHHWDVDGESGWARGHSVDFTGWASVDVCEYVTRDPDCVRRWMTTPAVLVNAHPVAGSLEQLREYAIAIQQAVALVRVLTSESQWSGVAGPVHAVDVETNELLDVRTPHFDRATARAVSHPKSGEYVCVAVDPDDEGTVVLTYGEAVSLAQAILEAAADLSTR